MSIRRPPAIILAWLASVAAPASAAEGMWEPWQMPTIAAPLRAAGYANDPQRIAELDRYPLNAVVSIGGCSAALVSPQGLVATNHHCAFGTIQYNTSAERNLIRDGFLAADLAAELPGDPNLRVLVTDRIDDVSADIGAAVQRAGRSDLGAWAAVEARSKALVHRCESAGPYRCELAVFNAGERYALVRQLEIRDVRLVHAPALAVGKFGGEVDNWMWPRHGGDYAFLRAYVGRDGKPAAFSRDNVPYRPAAWLRVAPRGVAAGDLVMVAGYPGRTNRWRLADELGDAIDWTMPNTIAQFQALAAIIGRQAAGRPEVAIKYASTLAGLANTQKNFQGQLEGFARNGGLLAKRAEEAALSAWLDARKDVDGSAALQALRSAVAQARSHRERDYRFGLLVPYNLPASPRFNREGSLLAAAMDLYRLSIERGKPDARRESGYQQRDEPRIRARLEMFERRFDAATDRALLDHRLRHYAALPAAQRLPELDEWLGNAADTPDLAGLDARLDALYAGTRVHERDSRLAWLDASRARVEASDDSALRLAVALYPALLRIEQQAKAAAGAELRLRPRYLRAMAAFQASRGRPLYADANGTLRLSFGNVVGYSPQDAVTFEPFTRLAGLRRKATGVAPFDAPARLLEAIDAGRGGAYAVPALGDVPVDFLADLDITGGNSGSPTLNADGELVGLVFDGNWESVASSWVWDGARTRSIHVDIRYMLWVMDEVDHAERLIREMGLEPATP